MSDDSSNPAQQAVRPHRHRGWVIALTTVCATLFLYFAAQALGGLLISIYPLMHHWSGVQAQDWLSNSVLAQFFFGLLADGLLVLGVAWMLKFFHWHWRDIGLRLPELWHIGVGLLATAPYYVLYIIIVVIVSALIPGLNVDQKQDIGFHSVHGMVPLALTFVSLVVIPPLAEELTMRGFLYTGLRKWLPKVLAALVVSALFGAAHLAEGGSAGPLWIGAIDTFTLSLVLVFLREKTGNLWAGITLHAAKNAIAFAMLFVVGSR
ncbi:MAG TPA: type II CAAX endopeptidase family protein [Candidatus Saccharimonadales bacterium]|nr:type II CAAX endopeptidase family protein [Candidatus Saccharimonadales bacterium]